MFGVFVTERGSGVFAGVGMCVWGGREQGRRRNQIKPVSGGVGIRIGSSSAGFGVMHVLNKFGTGV